VHKSAKDIDWKVMMYHLTVENVAFVPKSKSVKYTPASKPMNLVVQEQTTIQ
jgi:hypothetical protein